MICSAARNGWNRRFGHDINRYQVQSRVIIACLIYVEINRNIFGPNSPPTVSCQGHVSGKTLTLENPKSYHVFAAWFASFAHYSCRVTPVYSIMNRSIAYYVIYLNFYIKNSHILRLYTVKLHIFGIYYLFSEAFTLTRSFSKSVSSNSHINYMGIFYRSYSTATAHHCIFQSEEALQFLPKFCVLFFFFFIPYLLSMWHPFSRHVADSLDPSRLRLTIAPR